MVLLNAERKNFFTLKGHSIMATVLLKNVTKIYEGGSVAVKNVSLEINDKEFVVELGIRSVPTIKGFNNGNERFSEVGLKQRDVIMEMTSRL